MDALHILSHELLATMGYVVVDDNNVQVKELQRALINFFFVGMTFGELKEKNKNIKV